MHRMLESLFGLVLALPNLAPPQDPPKLQPPSPAEQAEAEKLVKDIFKEDYAKRTPADKLALSKKLLLQGVQSLDDPKSQFVLLREARELAGQAGDLAASLSAIDEMAKRFVVDELGLKHGALVAAAKTAKVPDDFRGLATASIRLVDAALFADQYDVAEKLASSASQYAKRSLETSLVNRSAARSKEVVERKSRHEKVRKARETLAATPDDGPSNLLVGRFECFVKSNWPVGLPLLAKGSEPGLQTLAQKEMADPTDPAEQAAVGDGWWELAEKEKEPAAKDSLREHALHWYSKALEKLTGLQKAKLEKRLAEHMAQKLSRGSWLDVTDPKLFGMTGKAGDPIEMSAKQGYYAYKTLQFPKGDFDGISVRLTLDSTKLTRARVYFEGPRELAAALGTGSEVFGVVRNTTTNFDFSRPWVKKNESLVNILLIEDEYVFYLDYREMGRVKTERNRITHLRLEADEGAVKFDRIQLRRLE